MVEASFTGLIRTVLILIGVFVIVRFIGQLMNAKRNMAEQADMKNREEKMKKAKEHTARNLGKTTILRKGRNAPGDIEDVDFEEIDD